MGDELKSLEREPKFLVEGSLGKLARNLRMFGLDAQWANLDPVALTKKGVAEGRWILTRKVRYPWGETPTIRVIKITEDLPERQVVTVLKHLSSPIDPSRWFTRCIRCNELLEEVSAAVASGCVPDYVAICYNKFKKCPKCQRFYWPGTHRDRMVDLMRAWAKEAWGTKGTGHEQKAEVN